jgi:DNA repair protein RadD
MRDMDQWAASDSSELPAVEAFRRAPKLRDYQMQIMADVAAKVAAGVRRLLLPLPTAAGKTVIAASIVADAVSAGCRVLILVHRQELITQTSAKLYAVGVDHGIIKAGFPTRLGERVQVASIQTLDARAMRTSSIELPVADLVIVDEAHHARASTYRKLLAAYPGAVILGLSATPCRSDGKGLGDIFDALVDCPSVADLTHAGYLVPTRVYAPSRPDLTGVRIAHGDYAESQLAERMNTGQLVGDVVTHWLRLAERRRTVVFATGVAHSKHLRDEFCRAGILAEHIDGKTPTEERDAILTKLAAGRIDVVCNAMVLTEGWDSPEVSCLVLARPTKSMGLYRQMVGRVLRLADGKADALILDHAGAVFEHGFIDESVNWTLASDKRAENPTQTSRSLHEMPKLTACPECTAVRVGGQQCGVCGWRPQPKGLAVDVADGELGEVGRDKNVQKKLPSAAEKQTFYRELRGLELQRGYKFGWAAHKAKEKFGTWPATKQVVPLPPSPETLSWVRYRQIAYAKGQGRAA